MAYAEFVTTNLAEILDAFSSFAAANGWTVEADYVDSGRKVVVVKRPDTDYFHFERPSAASTTLQVRASTGFDPGITNPASQAGATLNIAQCNLLAGPFIKTYFFAVTNPHAIFAVVEHAPLCFRHFCCGVLQKFGAYTGGGFFDATFWNQSSGSAPSAVTTTAHSLMLAGAPDLGSTTSDEGVVNCGAVRCDVDSLSPLYARITRNTATTSGAQRRAGSGIRSSDIGTNGFFSRSDNTFSGTTTLFPLNIYIERASSFFSPIGVVPGIRFCNMRNFQPGDEFTVGADTWKVFPWVRKGEGSGTNEFSGNRAFAFLKTG